MGRLKGAYGAEIPVGTRVRVRDHASLELFVAEWRCHNPLQAAQLESAGKIGLVAETGFYHGGDELNRVEGFPGLWHEENLELVQECNRA